jgi:hypothetical protein
MPKNLLVLRASPDWVTFDIERSRGFLKALRLPEDLVIEFAALWARHFKVDYRGVRAQLKAIALETYNAVRQASLVHHQDWDGSAPAGGRIAFVDDDDWMAPDLFERLPVPVAGEDGVRWGSLRLGRVFGPDGYAVPIIQRRQLDCIIYTNNYAVTSRALNRLGRAASFEHDAAQRSFDRSDFAPVASQQYLSCAVKHPCCTMSVNYLMSQPSFRADPRKEMTDFMAAMDAMSFDDMDAWLLRPFGQFREVMAEAASSR